MTATRYDDSINGALERLAPLGFVQTGGFAAHGPMAAEALASLGYCDQVADWIDWNLGYRDHEAMPAPGSRIDRADEADWRGALGRTDRGGDWKALFDAEITELGWSAALGVWWPRLLPGLMGGLTHGLIRTAHAVRAVNKSGEPSLLELDELSRGLAFWASVHTPVGGPGPDADGADPLRDGVGAALSELTANYSGLYALSPGAHPVPLVHTVTAPAAVRLILPYVDESTHEAAYRNVAQVCSLLRNRMGGRGGPAGAPSSAGSGSAESAEAGPASAADLHELAERAADRRDEHVIKLTEAALREYALNPDPRYLAAVNKLMELIPRPS